VQKRYSIGYENLADDKALALAIENNLFRRGVYLAFVLIAALVWFEFGRDAEHQVVDLGWDLTTMVGIVVFPVLLIGLIAAPTALVNWTDWKRRSDVFSD
jgi:hypothetical protein